MNKALIIIKSPGIGDLQILLAYVQELSKELDRPVSILAQKSTHARAIFKKSFFPRSMTSSICLSFLNIALAWVLFCARIDTGLLSSFDSS